MKVLRGLALMSLLGSMIVTASPLHKRARSDPLPPSKDQWYSAPAGYENTTPGTVLRVRQAPGNLTDVIGNSSAIYNILFRTTDGQYRPTWAVTSLLVPELGSDSAATHVDASPSYYLHSSATSKYPFGSELGSALGLGIFASVPDYEGPLDSFTSGVISGHATLDSVRAILSVGLGLNTTSPRVVLWGCSGASPASEWASELAVRYAPDLAQTGVVVGAALGGLTPSMSSVLENISGKAGAGLATTALLGLRSQYPEVQKSLISLLKPSTKEEFWAARGYTVDEARVSYAGHEIGDYFVHGATTFQEPELLTVINHDGVMGYHGVPRWPIFVYKSIPDEISEIPDTDKLIERYCRAGANILYQRNSVGTHAEEYYYGLSAAVEWLASILTGTYAKTYNTQGCTIKNVTNNSTSSPLKKRRDWPNGAFDFL